MFASLCYHMGRNDVVDVRGNHRNCAVDARKRGKSV